MNEIETILLEMIRESIAEVNESHNQDYRPVIIYSNDLLYVDCALYADTLQMAYNLCHTLNKLFNTTIILHFNDIDIDILSNESYEEILEKYNKICTMNHNIIMNRKYEITIKALNGNDTKKISRLLKQLYSLEKNEISTSLKHTLSYKLYQNYKNTEDDLYIESKIEKTKQLLKNK